MNKSLFKRVIVLILTFSILALSVLPAGTFADDVRYGVVCNTDGDVLNVRSSAGTGGSIVGTLNEGDTVTIVGEASDSAGRLWYKISSPYSGYVCADYISITSEPSPGDPGDTGDYETELARFPADYQSRIREIHAVYPNYVFVADYTGVDFWDLLAAQNSGYTKVVEIGYDGISWRAMQDNYDWSSGTWYESPPGYTTVATEVLAYYLDPRNFITADNISLLFQFLVQSYDAATQTKAMLTSLVSGTFLAKTYTYDKNEPLDAKYKGSYIDMIMAAGKESGVNPLVLASTILQEQGVNGTSQMISGTFAGYEGYYNFFNYAASGSQVITNGLSYAKKQGWSSRALSIMGGAKMYGSGYIQNNQFTYYYKDFNVLNRNYNHQYAQLVYDQVSSGYILAKPLKDDTDASYVFHIPVYDNMPSNLCERPVEDSRLNNYYILDLKLSGLSGTFDKYVYDYSASVSKDTTATLILPTTAVYGGNSSYSLAKGSNYVELPVWSESGYSRTYTLTIQASKACKLTIKAVPITTNLSDTSVFTVTLPGLKTAGGLQWTKYTGSARTPSVSVKWGGITLIKGTDYTVSYSNNTDIGTATATITGTGSFKGTVTKQFVICFEDVKVTHNYWDAVRWAAGRGIASGYSGSRLGTFGVQDSVTRGQVIMFLWRAAGKPSPKSSKQTFKDVPVSHNYYKAIQWAYEKGIAAGYSSGSFGVSDTCSRGQIMVFLWRLAGKPAPKKNTKTFSDVPVSHNYFKAVQWASEQKITAGYSDGSFGVSRTCTRGQCVTFLYRMLGD